MHTEYKIIGRYHPGFETLEEHFNSLAQEGWEFVCPHKQSGPLGGESMFIFKKEPAYSAAYPPHPNPISNPI